MAAILVQGRDMAVYHMSVLGGASTPIVLDGGSVQFGAGVRVPIESGQ